MKKLLLPLLGALLLGTVLVSLSSVVSAAPDLQLTPFPTPTPGPDGRILYTVQPNDTCFRIAAVAGISVDELRNLNNLDAECVVIPGQVLLLGIVGVEEATPAPAASPVPSGPTPTSGPGTATVCVVLFLDENGDAMRQEPEPSIGDGAVSLSERTGLYSDGGTTEEGFDPEDEDLAKSVCFEGLPEGNYNVSVAVPEGYNPTTALNTTMELSPGDETTLNFGAQLSTEAQLENPPVQEGGRSPLLGVAGFALLLGGIILAVLSSRLRQGRPQRSSIGRDT